MVKTSCGDDQYLATLRYHGATKTRPLADLLTIAELLGVSQPTLGEFGEFLARGYPVDSYPCTFTTT
jgi:hypothetical protein